MTSTTFPLRLDATLEAPLSRWLWLVKWLLAIPHYIVLALLWVAFFLLSVVAFFGIVFTGRYPRAIFDFNVGVMRWTWRVQYYSYGALGTDHYPPFTLAEVPGYPAHLEVSYPEHLSRGLVLVKWWLLAIPQYVIVGIFLGGGTWLFQQAGAWHLQWGGGLIGILVLIAAMALLFTGRYPQSVFDLLIGLNRWGMRVLAYAGLMTDEYPPFRLDMGGYEPSTLQLTSPPPEAPHKPARPGWTGGRVTSVVIGSLAALLALGLLAGSAVVTWADKTQREDGYLTSPRVTLNTASYAIAGKNADLGAGRGPNWTYASSAIGTIRLRVRPLDSSTPVFVGIATVADVNDYLDGVSHAVLRGFTNGTATYTEHRGVAPRVAPMAAESWVAQASGTGQQELVWKVRSGRWAVVVMNADASPGVAVRADVGATVPVLPWVALGLLIGGVLVLVLSAVLIAVPVHRAGRQVAAAA